MKPFTIVEAVAAPMRADNIDTDQIIPARFLRTPRKQGYAGFLFHDERFDAEGNENPDFVLNRPAYRDAQIIVAGRNFACGSSREGAVYALADYGIRSVIASSFSDIFFNNALINGLLPVRLEHAQVEQILDLLEAQETGVVVKVDLVDLQVQAGDLAFGFRLDGLKRRCLLEGLDEISLTLTYASQIAAFEDRHYGRLPWLKRVGEAAPEA